MVAIDDGEQGVFFDGIGFCVMPVFFPEFVFYFFECFGPFLVFLAIIAVGPGRCQGIGGQVEPGTVSQVVNHGLFFLVCTGTRCCVGLLVIVRAYFQVDIGNDGFGFEDNFVLVHVYVGGFELFCKIGNVVGDAQEVFFVLFRTSFAGDFELEFGRLDGAPAFYGEQVAVGNAVVEDNTAVDFEHVGGFGEVP